MWVPVAALAGLPASCYTLTLLYFTFTSDWTELTGCFEGNDWQERGRLSLVPVDSSQRQASRGDLVFYENSPAFCDADAALGHHGVSGRRCNATSRGEDACQRMCCGRGYSSSSRPGRERCNCVFHWCCRVTCDTCLVQHIEHTCNWTRKSGTVA